MSTKTTGANAPSPTPKTTVAESKPTASDFIRAQPLTMKASDVVEAGKKAGLEVSSNLVYMVRSRLAANKGAPPKKRGRPSKSVSTMVGPTIRSTPTTSLGSAEHELARLILTVGFERAENVFKRLKAALA